MKIGIGLPNAVRDVHAEVIPRWARSAEEAGFASLGTIGRIAYPGVMDTVALAAAAAVTSRIGLVTSVLLSPAWPPVLLAKEAANIDALSGGRLVLGIGLGARDDDYVDDARGPKRRGPRLDDDLEVYRKVWRGETVGIAQNPFVPKGTREVPIVFGGGAPKTFRRIVKHGAGYIAAALPPAVAEGAYEQTRKAWADAGREGPPRLMAITYFGLADPDASRAGIADYYAFLGPDISQQIAQGVHVTPQAVKDVAKAFQDIGCDELIYCLGNDVGDEVKRLADVML